MIQEVAGLKEVMEKVILRSSNRLFKAKRNLAINLPKERTEAIDGSSESGSESLSQHSGTRPLSNSSKDQTVAQGEDSKSNRLLS